jgi:uridine kinase
LADELAAVLRARGRGCIRASIDGFHQPRAKRHRRGRLSADGYYLDSFDIPTLRRELLDPLGPGGRRRFRRAVFDHRRDLPLSRPVGRAPVNAILLFDGIFLLRPELRDCWDVTVFVDVRIESASHRAMRRDGGPSRGQPDLYLHRYTPAQRRYLAEVNPRDQADAVLINDDIEEPRLLVRDAATLSSAGVGTDGI